MPERISKLVSATISKIRSFLQLSKGRAATIKRLLASEVGRVEAINRLLTSEAGRVETISRLLALEASRVETITRLLGKIDDLEYALEDNVAAVGRLSATDAERVETIERLLALDAERVRVIGALGGHIQSMDGISAAGRNLSFLDDPIFKSAWATSAEANVAGWPEGVPDIRWRAHIAVWAARHGMTLEGDFVECGVHTGLLSMVICRALNFESLPRTFYLFDTFNGIPTESLAAEELDRVLAANSSTYGEVFEVAKRNFSPYPNAKLIRGILPDSLRQASIEKIAYLSMDLNNAGAEHGVISALWDRLVPGAIVLIDDYAWVGCELQKNMWDDFSGKYGLSIAALPTGQGLLLKPFRKGPRPPMPL